MTSVYIHLPFCPYICPYCDFAKWRYRAEPAARYLTALEEELARAPRQRAATAYLGGGTPNAYAANEVASLVARVSEHFSIADEAEITVEVNPDPALCEGFGEYRAAGVNRLSIGAQSFATGELRALGRRHAPEDVAQTVRRARAAGFDNISIDLMFGAPGQTVASWRATLESALELGVEHISTYGLTVEQGTPYARWFAREPAAFASDDLGADLYETAIELLGKNGYEHYEISNFALPGRTSTHNANYWANGDYTGFGVGAASYRDGVRRTNTRSLAVYVEAALGGGPIPGESERLEGAARVGEAAMLALRTRQGVDVRAFEERYGVDFFESYGAVLTDLRRAGLLQVTATHVALTMRGRFVANDVCAAFIVSP